MGHWYYLVARRKTEVSIAQAQSDVTVLGTRHRCGLPGRRAFVERKAFGAFAVPLEDVAHRSADPPLPCSCCSARSASCC